MTSTNIVELRALGTDAQHRLIEYWKLRSEQCSHEDEIVRQRLTDTFRSANAGNEEVEYWMQIVEKTNGRTECKMLFEAFEANGDRMGAYQFWKSRISRGEMRFWDWDLLEGLTEKRNGVGFTDREFINICKAELQRDRSDVFAAGALAKASKSLTDMGARITLLKNALDTFKLSSSELEHRQYDLLEVEIAREIVVEELARAILERGDENYAVGFWTTLVRKFPYSWSVSRALQTAFAANGDDQAAVQFWRRMRRVAPKEQHFAYFFAESCKNAGEFEEPMKILWLWLEYFLSRTEEPEDDEFDEETIVDYLNNAIRFDHELPEIIEIWEASLKKHPAKDWPDTRQKCLASALLDYSSHLPPHAAQQSLQKAANISPDHEEIVLQLRTTFEMTGLSHLEGGFWMSQIGSTNSLFSEPQAWYYVRLAQFYSSRHAHEDMKYSIKKVVELRPYGVWDAVRSLDVGSDVREFWRLFVMSTPVNRCVDILEVVCNHSQYNSSSNIRMWQSLVRGNLSYSPFSSKLVLAYQKERQRDPLTVKEEIEFWKECIRSKRTQAHHLCYALVDAYKWKREHDVDSDPSTAFDKEISMWRTLLLEQGPDYAVDWDEYGIPGQLHKAIKAKADAIGDNLQSVLEVWKNARDLWIRFHVLGRSLETKTKIKGRIDDASAIVQLLEHGSRTSI